MRTNRPRARQGGYLGSKGSLRLRGTNFSLDLQGDQDFIRKAYESLREDIAQQIRPADGDPGRTLRIPALNAGPQPDLPDNTQEFVWVRRCTELYSKVSVSQRAAIAQSPLGKVIHSWRLRGIYLETEESSFLEHLVPPGKTLWSEFTSSARDRFERK